MEKPELVKSIEATKLNKRTGIPTTDPPATVPFGAILSDVEQDREFANFTYLGERYRCLYDSLLAAVASPAERDSRSEPQAAAAPARAPEGLRWEEIPSDRYPAARAKVPGGWLVTLEANGALGVGFYPDPKHAWS